MRGRRSGRAETVGRQFGPVCSGAWLIAFLSRSRWTLFGLLRVFALPRASSFRLRLFSALRLPRFFSRPRSRIGLGFVSVPHMLCMHVFFLAAREKEKRKGMMIDDHAAWRKSERRVRGSGEGAALPCRFEADGFVRLPVGFLMSFSEEVKRKENSSAWARAVEATPTRTDLGSSSGH